MFKNQDFRVGLLGMSALCMTCGLVLAVNMVSIAMPAPREASHSDADRAEALRILASTYGVRVPERLR